MQNKEAEAQYYEAHDKEPSYMKNMLGGAAIGTLASPGIGTVAGAGLGALRAKLHKNQWKKDKRKREALIAQGYAQAHGYPQGKEAAFMAGYTALDKQANPVWKNNEWRGGGANPLNWLSRGIDAATGAGKPKPKKPTTTQGTVGSAGDSISNQRNALRKELGN